MLGRVMLIPWLGIVVFAVIIIAGGGLAPDSMYLCLLLWMFASLAAGLHCRREVPEAIGKKNDFRLAASGDFDALNQVVQEEVVPEEAPQAA
jgi:hypothetical protein